MWRLIVFVIIEDGVLTRLNKGANGSLIYCKARGMATLLGKMRKDLPLPADDSDGFGFQTSQGLTQIIVGDKIFIQDA